MKCASAGKHNYSLVKSWRADERWAKCRADSISVEQQCLHSSALPMSLESVDEKMEEQPGFGVLSWPLGPSTEEPLGLLLPCLQGGPLLSDPILIS